MTQEKRSLIELFDRFNRKVNKYFSILSGILILIISLLIFQDVIRRYILNDPTSWILDLSGFLLVYVVFLSLSPALESGNHVSVDLVNEVASQKIQRVLRIIVLLITVVFGIILFWETLSFALQAAVEGSVSTSTIQIPMKYIYVIAPIGICQFILTAVNLFFHTCFMKSSGKYSN